MPLTNGFRLGPYKILAPLGAGGMGEVYQARDTRLERVVAIKILPHELSDDATRRQRFEREAKVISSLNHPHICTLYDVGQQDGMDFIVMEFLEGESLAQRLQKGALSPAQVLAFGTQIASALDKAHRNGVTHRDLKPGNIMLTKSGAKLLDFGLAKADPALASGATLTDMTPRATPMTMHGAVIGTVPYMSPEQVEGNEADARSDIFSLGTVLYEMATGKRAFQGKSEFSVASDILHKQPEPISAVQPLTPPALERTIQVCMAKDPDERWQSAGDLWKELRWIAEGGSQTGAAITRPFPPKRHLPIARIAIIASVCAVIAVAALLLALRIGRSPEPLSFRQLNFRREAIFQAAFAGDNETVVYSASTTGNTPQIFVVRPDYPGPQPLGPPGTHLLAVSSKGELAVLKDVRYVGFRLFTGTLARMPLSGGAPREVLEGVRQADWSPDGSQLAVIREVAGKDRLEYPVGKALREVSGYVSDLRFSPSGDRIAYFEHPRKWDDRGSINIVDLAGNNTVLSDGYWSERGLAWSPNGKEILFSASQSGGSFTVYAVTLAGERRIAYQPPGGLTIEDVSRDGRWLATRIDYRYRAMVHVAGDPGVESRDEDRGDDRAEDRGKDRDLSWLNTSHARALSQDGRTLLFAETALGTNYAVCLRKTDGSPVVRLGEGWPADLSPDGKSVLAVVQSRPPQLVVYPTGAGETQQLKRGDIEHYITAQWLRDGKNVLINGNETGKSPRFYIQETGVQQAGRGSPRPVTPEGTRDGLLSFDGSQILARGPEGKYSIYPVAGGEPRPAPGLTHDDIPALWSADGRSVLVYRRAEIPCRLERLDLTTGHRTLFREFVPPDRTGLLSMPDVFVTDDLRSYAYTAYYQVSTLFVSENKQ
jgi:predicted Ser/Thr protein kinase